MTRPDRTMRFGALAHSTRGLMAGALIAAGLLSGAVLSAAPAMAQSQLTVSHAAIGSTQRVQLGLNKSLLVDLPTDAREVIVSQPAVATSLMRTKRRAVIQGTGVGATNILYLDAAGNRIAVIDIVVVQDGNGLASTLARVLPGSGIRVDTVGDGVVLSGTAQSQDDAAKAISVATQFVGSADRVSNLIAISGGQQVMLKVTVAEVSRQATKELGINLNATIGGGLSTGLITSTTAASLGSLTLTGSVGAVNLVANLRALERRGAMRTLAEPTLTALSGEEAEFMAGGEFPVPVNVDNNKITYEFKPFGVNLKFTPTVMNGGLVGLVVDTSVSEPTAEGAVVVNGMTIPATRERKARTSVQLQVGDTLAIAGLMQDNVRQQISAFPGLGNIPILGALFRSREFVRNQTELLILVTPYVAQPNVGVEPPTASVGIATDAEAIFLGHMERLYGVGPAGTRGGYSGSFGFVLE